MLLNLLGKELTRRMYLISLNNLNFFIEVKIMLVSSKSHVNQVVVIDEHDVFRHVANSLHDWLEGASGVVSHVNIRDSTWLELAGPARGGHFVPRGLALSQRESATSGKALFGSVRRGQQKCPTRRPLQLARLCCLCAALFYVPHSVYIANEAPGFDIMLNLGKYQL